MAVPPAFTVRKATRSDVSTISAFVDGEGWEFDRNLLYCMCDMDPTAWYVAENEDGEIVGVRALARFTPSVTAGGVYIVKPEYRGCGVGRLVNQASLETLADSNVVITATNANIYKRAGFVLDYELYLKRGHVSLIREGLTKMNMDSKVTVMKYEPAMKSDLELYDSETCGHERSFYFETWIVGYAQSVFIARDRGRVVGYGCLRRASFGLEIAPLYANSDVVAWILLKTLLEQIPEEEEVCMYDKLQTTDKLNFKTAPHVCCL